MQGPQAIIMAGPPAITGTPAAEFFFSAEGAASFSCRLLGGGAASQAAAAITSAFTACSNPTCACRFVRALEALALCSSSECAGCAGSDEPWLTHA